MVAALAAGLAFLSILAALAWCLSGADGRDVARYWLIAVMRTFQLNPNVREL